MGYRILALLEDNVATTLLLTSRLADIGHRLVIACRTDDFARRMEADRFDWVVLDGTVMRGIGSSVRSALTRHLRGARIVWIGEPPRFVGIAITSRFSKPPSYDGIADAFRRFQRLDEESEANARQASLR